MARPAELLINLRANTAQASRHIEALKHQVRSLETGVVGSKGLFGGGGGGLGIVGSAGAAALAGLATVGLAAGAGVAAGLGLSVKTAADFEQSLADIRSLLSPAEARTYGGALRDLAITLGKDTKFSAGQAAEGIQELVKAGIPIESVLNGGARAALNLATAGGIPVAEAANLAGSALNAFQRPVKDLPKIVDFLAGAANASAADMTDLRYGLAASGAVANLVGLSFEDNATALALFSNHGLRGQDAGTSFKTMLMGLQPQTKAQTALFKQLGIITADGTNQFFDAQGRVKDLAGISGVLTNALKGMTKQQQLATLETLFGSDAVRAAAIVADEGAAGVQRLREEISKTTAADVANERLNTLKGRMEQLKGSAETLGIAIGTPLLEPLGNLATRGTEALNGLTTSVEGFLAQTAALAADQGISQFDAAILLTKGNIEKTFGPESAALFQSFTTTTKEGLQWIIDNAPKAFASVTEKAPGAIEALAGTINKLGTPADLRQQGIERLGLNREATPAVTGTPPAGGPTAGDVSRGAGEALSAWWTGVREALQRGQESGGTLAGFNPAAGRAAVSGAEGATQRAYPRGPMQQTNHFNVTVPPGTTDEQAKALFYAFALETQRAAESSTGVAPEELPGAA